MGDIDYIVDLCDEVLEAKASRDHTFGWLRTEDGTLAPVAAYYEEQALAVVVLDASRDLEPEAWLRDRLVTLLGRGMHPAVMTTDDFARDETGTLRRRHREDRRVIAEILDAAREPTLRHELLVKLGLVEPSSHGWASYGPVADEDWYEPDHSDGWDDEDDDDDVDDPFDEDDLVAGIAHLGWRSRPIAQAILGAAVLGRRAFETRYAGPKSSLDLQVLLTLLLLAEEDLSEEGAQEAGALALTLAAPSYEVQASLKRLRSDGLVERPPGAEQIDEVWAITRRGVEEIYAWLARAACCFPAGHRRATRPTTPWGPADRGGSSDR